MKKQIPPSYSREQLSDKPLLNINESRTYLGLSRRDFNAIENRDPSFPQRKTKTKHSKELLDDWLRQNGVPWWEQKNDLQLSSRATKFKLSIDQLN